MISCLDSESLRAWDVRSGDEVCRFEENGDLVLSTTLMPDRDRALSLGARSLHEEDEEESIVVRLWDVESEREICSFGDEVPDITCLAPSPDGRRVLTGHFDGGVRLWNVESGREIQNFQGHEGGVMAITFSSDGQSGFSGGDDGMVRQWELPFR